MKKYFYILLFLSFVSSKIQSQNLVDTSKTWNVVEHFNYGEKRTYIYYFEGDTSIGLQTFNKMKVFDPQDSLEGLFILVREDSISKRTYFNNYLAYDFSLNLNDTFITNASGCQVEMIVDSIDTVSILDGSLRKRMFLTGLFEDVWIEGIGSTYGLPHPFLYFCSADFFTELNCFHQNDTLLYMSGVFPNCLYNTVSVGENQSMTKVSIGPNPFSDYTILGLKHSGLSMGILEIFNCSGQSVRRSSFSSQEEMRIERGNLNSGVYYLKLSDSSENSTFGEIILIN